MNYIFKTYSSLKLSEPYKVCPYCGMKNRIKKNKNTKTNNSYKYLYLCISFSMIIFILNIWHIISPNTLHKILIYKKNILLQFLMSSCIMLLGGTPIFLKAYVSIKSWTLNMYSLITLGVLITYFYSVIIYCISLIFKINHPEFLHIHFSAASIIITLALTGKFLQTKSIYKTNKEILSLINLIPQNATLINKKGKEQKINLCCIKIGDQLKIGHGENIPVDGIVLYGKGYVDTSMFTGEFFPKKKTNW